MTKLILVYNNSWFVGSIMNQKKKVMTKWKWKSNFVVVSCDSSFWWSCKWPFAWSKIKPNLKDNQKYQKLASRELYPCFSSWCASTICLPTRHLSTKKNFKHLFYIFLMHTWTMHINMVIFERLFLGEKSWFLKQKFPKKSLHFATQNFHNTLISSTLATSILIKLFYRKYWKFQKLQGVPNSTNNQYPQFIMGVISPGQNGDE